MIRNIFILILLLIASPLHAVNYGLIKSFEDRFNTTKSLQADFIQRSPDGSKLRGKLYLQTPKKMRMNYGAPLNDFILSDGTFLYYWDAKLRQQSHMLLKSSPAAFLLQRPINFTKDFKIEKLDEIQSHYALELKDKTDPNALSLTLFFNKLDKQLIGWIIQDSFQQKTTVSLSNIKYNITLARSLFLFKKPKKS